MPSFAECINKAVQNKSITRELADEILASDDPQDAIDDLLADASRQKREAAIQAVRISQTMEDVFSHPDGAYAGIRAVLGQDPTGHLGTTNVEQLTKFYQGRNTSRLAELYSRLRTRTLGFTQDEEAAENFIKAVFSESVEEADIQRFGKEWLEAVEEVRKDFNRQGGSIAKNENFLLPQNHDLQKVKKAGYENWRNFVMTKLGRSKMLNDAGKPLSDEELEQGLEHSYQSIITGGLNKLNPIQAPSLRKKLSRRHSERRFMYFKDAQSWIDYQNKFGRGSIYSTLTDYMENMANDTALLARLGPNPKATYDAVISQAQLRDQLNQTQKVRADSLFKTVTGQINRGDLTIVADGMQMVRNVLTAAFLPAAWLSAFADVSYMSKTADYNNIPFLKIMRRNLQLTGPNREKSYIFATRMGLMADNWNEISTSASRFGEITGVGFSAKIAQGVMRASFLSPWTNALQKSFGMEFSAMLADNVNVKFADLDESMLTGFKRYGITEKDWDLFRSQELLDFDGAKFADLTKEGGLKFHQMIMTERDYATPVPTARVRSITSGGMERGSISGQAWRTAMMLKSFPFTIAATHFYRIFYEASMGSRIKYAGALLATTTVMGAVSLQMKDIAAGRNPRPMMGENGLPDPKFILAALVQGGGLSLPADFLYADSNRYGSGPASTVFGPTGQLYNDLDKLLKGNVQEFLAGEETDFGREAVRFAKRYTPSLWQIDLLRDSMFDELEKMVDPSAEKRFSRIMRSRERDYGQDYWWEPGKMAPEEAPQLGTMLEESPKR